CTGAGSSVTCNLDWISPGTDGHVTLWTTVDAAGTLAASASVRSGQPDANLGDNDASLSLGLLPTATPAPVGAPAPVRVQPRPQAKVRAPAARPKPTARPGKAAKPRRAKTVAKPKRVGKRTRVERSSKAHAPRP